MLMSSAIFFFFQGASELLHFDAAPETYPAQPEGLRGSRAPGLAGTVCPSGQGWLGLEGRARVEEAGSSLPQQLPPKLCPSRRQ